MRAGVLSALLCAGLVVALLGDAGPALASTVSTAPTASTAPTSQAAWPYPNGDLANTRDALGSTITSQNVGTLREAWSFKLSGKGATTVGHEGSLTANPVVVDGVVYVQDLECDVYALSLSTGALLWKYPVGQPDKQGPGPNGVAVAGTVVYGLTPTTAFALDAKTGKRIWVDRKILDKGQGTFGIQPQVATGRVYLASQYGPAPGGGVLVALRAKTGALLWKFDTAVGPDPGVKALGAGSGGAWETPLVGTDGSVTFGTGNPYQKLGSAISHPARLLYTDSDVNLTAATGKLRWYYQGVPDDFMDWDMQTSPISATAGGVPVVIGSGKMGYVYEMNAKNGTLLWKTPVGKHDGNDHDGVLALKHRLHVKVPFSSVPGGLGGVLSNLAVAGNTIYVATNDFTVKVKSLTTVAEFTAASGMTGEVEALSLTTGKVEWDTKVPSLPLGAITVSNDLVFTTLFTGRLLALDRSTGAIVYRQKLPTSTNAPIAIAGDTIVIPEGGLETGVKAKDGRPQVVAYRPR
ncbi:MAG: PQQ-binding-like beta-propeller repeat protein [Acidimicrobiales bacterium]